MAPLAPHWQQPSHPDIQKVVVNEAEYTSKSLSKVALPPFAVFARLDGPPCTVAEEPTYATVQTARETHVNLNSDLLYINHSCEPSLIFDTGSMKIIVGPKGLQPGDELTFFYPSTEWDMAQPFDCLCGKPSCRGAISGAKNMAPEQLEGIWLSGHVRELLDEHRSADRPADRRADRPAGPGPGPGSRPGNGGSEKGSENGSDPTVLALRDALAQAEKAAEAARRALDCYVGGAASKHGHGDDACGNGTLGKPPGLHRRGPTSRELSGEMGGDTAVASY